MRWPLLVVLLGCGSQPHSAAPDAVTASDAAPAELAYGERCGDGIDNDGDGLVDEDCAPSLFAGVYAPQVAADPALAAIEAATGRPLAVVQTYHSTSAAGVANIAPDLAAIFARGQVAHLNIEPAGYASYAAPNSDPLAHDLAATATAIAGALAAAPHGRVILTFGAEMNGNWTDWGCLPADQYIALYRAAHAALDTALATAQVAPRRVRWAYGPNSTSSASCGSAAGYYPGHAFVDLLGMSAYRSGTATVTDAVIAPMSALFDALAYPAAWRHDRFVVLQTGSRAVQGDDRAAWVVLLVATLAADDRAAGIIYFDAADWAAGADVLGPAIATMPIADRGLDGVFAPQFWDVPYDHPAFGEIQALADAGVTSGCATAPARFCPDDPIAGPDAATLVARAFAGAQVTLGTPVMETELATAIVNLGGAATEATPGAIATRARAAVLLAHGARIALRAL